MSREREAVSRLVDEIRRQAMPVKIEPIVQWVQSHVDMSYDHTSSASGMVRLYPYQIEPLEATEKADCREVTLCWAPRLGKSSVWKLSLLKRIHDGGLSGLIVYPSAEMAERTNRDTVRPLIESLPEVRHDLFRRGNVKRTRFTSPRCAVCSTTWAAVRRSSA